MNNINKLTFCIKLSSKSDIYRKFSNCFNTATAAYTSNSRIDRGSYPYSISLRNSSTKEVQSLYKPETFTTKLKDKISLFIARNRLSATAYILYESIADHVEYADMFQKLHLPDTFYSWFVITELYVWMLMVRYMAEGEEGRHIRNRIVEALWTDVKHRTKQLGAVSPSNVRLQISELSEQLHAAIVAYDEGLQTSDTILASALWRRFYQQQSVNPEHLDLLVKYIRRQMKLLDNMTKYELFEKRQIKWEPFTIG